MRSWLSVLIADAMSKKRDDIPIAPSLYSLSNKMDNSLLAVRDINHKYIVVEKGADKVRVERFKMEREGLVTEGQEVEISERSAVTGQYTYLVEPSIAMSGIYRTRQRIKSRKGKIQKIEQTDRGFYLLVEIDE